MCRLCALVVALTTLWLGAAARAQDALNPSAVEAFIDGAVEAYRQNNGIAGVTVAVVSRDGVILEKGYGFSAIGPERSVDAKTTQFRIASISKTFTYLLAMQLVDEGRLRLDAPADDYLPDALKFAGGGFPVPRLIDLMQHTAGFEDSALGHLFTRTPALSLEEYLQRYRPRRVRPPGAQAVYSNYGVALLGLIIARADGRSFEQSVQARILRPAGLSGIIFDDVSAESSSGFKRQEGWFEPQPTFYAGQIAPAASASATASAMARYMRLLLNGGTLDGVTILSPTRFAELASPSFRNAPVATSMAHGFISRRYGQLTSLEHDGAAIYFYSNMVIWPEAGLGLFVAVNTDSGASLTAALPRLFIEHVAPAARPSPPAPIATPPGFAESLAGTYAVTRRNYSTFEGFLQRVVSDATMAVRDDGAVVVISGYGVQRYVLEAPDVLREVNSGAKAQIQRDEAGAIVGLASASGVNGLRRLGWLDQPLTLIATAALVAFASLWCVIAFAVRLRYRAGRGQSIAEAAASTVEILTALIWLAAIGTLLAASLPMAAAGDAVVFDYPGPLLPVARTLLHIAAAASLVLLVVALLLMWRGPTWRLRRLTYAAYTALAVFTALLLWRWGALLTPLGIGL